MHIGADRASRNIHLKQETVVINQNNEKDNPAYPCLVVAIKIPHALLCREMACLTYVHTFFVPGQLKELFQILPMITRKIKFKITKF